MATKLKEGSAAEEKTETPNQESAEDARSTALKARYAKKPKKAPAKK